MITSFVGPIPLLRCVRNITEHFVVAATKRTEALTQAVLGMVFAGRLV
jgi:hypothetical protein